MSEVKLNHSSNNNSPKINNSAHSIVRISSPQIARSSPLDLGPRTSSSLASRFIMSNDSSTPVDSPSLKAIANLQEYFGHFPPLEPHESWLPITESRAGNSYFAAFHLLCSGIGIQALVLPLAFTVLGWLWGIISLILAFIWQLFTLWLLIQLHESDSGMRFSRYLRLAMVAFGEKLGKLLTLFPIMYLSGGTCATLIMIGGGTMEKLFELLCQETCDIKSLTTIEWYFLFACIATVFAQLPNLNSIAGISLIGAISAVTYCTLVWVTSVIGEQPSGVSYESLGEKSDVAKIFETLNALGVVAFAFRGHNLVLEIQGTMPSSFKCPSSVPMWKGVKFAYSIIAICLFPLAIGGYWAYGNSIPVSNLGLLAAMYKFHERDTSKFIIASTCILVVINCLCSFQIYAMQVFDNLEFRYTSAANKVCPLWLRTSLRVFFGCLASFIAVAFPFLPNLAGLFGGIALPITLAYPSFMWIIIKKPQKHGSFWLLNWVLGVFGLLLSVSIVTAAIWSIVTKGLEVNFLNPKSQKN